MPPAYAYYKFALTNLSLAFIR